MSNKVMRNGPGDYREPEVPEHVKTMPERVWGDCVARLWRVSRLHNDDVEYIRADLVKELK